MNWKLMKTTITATRQVYLLLLCSLHCIFITHYYSIIFRDGKYYIRNVKKCSRIFIILWLPKEYRIAGKQWIYERRINGWHWMRSLKINRSYSIKNSMRLKVIDDIEWTYLGTHERSSLLHFIFATRRPFLQNKQSSDRKWSKCYEHSSLNKNSPSAVFNDKLKKNTTRAASVQLQLQTSKTITNPDDI